MSNLDSLLNDIDSYKDTVTAIVGFLNLYRYDPHSNSIHETIKVFQGRIFDKEIKGNNAKAINKKTVTPDICVFLPDNSGVIGEVKINFPRDNNRWIDTFNQLMSYDDDLYGWPTESGNIDYHDIVLLLHQSRGADVLEYFQRNNGHNISFVRPFILVEFNRSDQRHSYFFFRKVYGTLSHTQVDGILKSGVQVPMEKLIEHYAKVKLYDAMPPMPYLMDLIWTYVTTPKAASDDKFPLLTKRQKLNIDIAIEDIVNTLQEGFYFEGLHGNTDRVKKIPCREWITKACNEFYNIGDGKWPNSSKDKFRFHFRKYPNTLEHFASEYAYVSAEEPQMLLSL